MPGASAGIALAVGACVAGGDGAVMEALPLCASCVLVQRAHAGYLYARCAALAGARVEWVDDVDERDVRTETGGGAASRAPG